MFVLIFQEYNRILIFLKKIFQRKTFWSDNYIEYESSSGRIKALSVGEYLYKIRPYLKDIINNLKKSDTWKMQLTIANKFVFSLDNDKEHVMHLKSDTKEIIINDETDEVIKD